ncbi:MAG TPA: nitrite/sulfite reductase [Thermoleophilaceae bacterium]|nr:nitrite/sulfite reductase [Thermoleophilaceae bacterium]
MEPVTASDTGELQKTGGRGSLESPEVYENVPGHVIPILEREFDDFDSRAGGFLKGEEGEDVFIPFRLKQGVYGQRQEGRQMIRVKLPFGGVNPDQLDAFADIAEQFTPLRKGHITTRQNIQYHHVPLADAAKVIRILGKVGLSSREACGNTVRNVTGDPYAGVTEGELFDITPYAGAFVRYFVRNEVCQLLPRKFKVAFTATDEDRAITNIHDLGFLPRIREGVRGVEIRTGGGTSIMPRVGSALYDFVEVDNGDYLKVSEAVLRIFDRQEDLRARRERARLKFMVDRIGIDAFREEVDRELELDWVNERDFTPDELLFLHDEEGAAPATPASYGSPNGDSREFDRFVESNVTPQRQAGFNAVAVKVTRGDLAPEQFRALAQLMRDFTGGYARTSVEQNLILRWVRDESLYDVWQRLREIDLGDAGAHEVTDVVSCPGTDSCKLGITASMGLNKAVQERLQSMQIDDPLTRKVHIKMSGCPNGCGQHHIANIGFYGASMKMAGRQVPAYVAHIAGQYDNGEVAMGQRLKVRLPARRVPEAVERWLNLYQSQREEGEEFNAFFARVGAETFEAEVKELSLPVEFSLETVNHFIDWNRHEPYKVVRGEGECAV